LYVLAYQKHSLSGCCNF